ncbi:thiamine phosphate synthase [Marinilabilia salmonicolor]|uniref:thiamine phosphate synthase n=1 Tax=Marinilabilia salmonicolor TaxID=989 RepID=UPI00029B0E80|nr:thiamine phosphate synthase [Marinilabilia salmonicolor]
MKPSFSLNLYLVTDRDLSLGRSLTEIVVKAAKGGVTMVQLREKSASTRQIIQEALQIKPILKKYGIPLIINDRVDVAMAIDADGVHLGQSDMNWQMARTLLGPEKIIGLSIENVDQLTDANEADIDYIGISPVFTTPTKKELSKGLGLSGTVEIAALSKHSSVAIGGINKTNAADILSTGTNGISVVSAICSAEDPEGAAKELTGIIKQVIKQP